MTIQARIEQKLRDALHPVHLQVINESHMHSGPASESHFKLVIVSTAFEGQPLIQRHRQVNALLKEELAGPVHALSMHTWTPEQWAEKGGEVPDSPPCGGGGA